jgi:hypothetical protein
MRNLEGPRKSGRAETERGIPVSGSKIETGIFRCGLRRSKQDILLGLLHPSV